MTWFWVGVLGLGGYGIRFRVQGINPGFGFWIQGFQSVEVNDLILGFWGSCEGCGVLGVRGIKVL